MTTSRTTRPIGDELDLRQIRYFVVLAEELHFTRAAARLLVAQQALSRDIQRLERRLGAPLFVRSTRNVALTPEGERLLVRARELLAVHDRIVDDLVAPGGPLIVDLLTEAPNTGAEILAAARREDPTLAVRRRYSQGMAAAIQEMELGRIDVAVGRVEGLGRSLPGHLAAQLVRLEPMALLLPESHVLFARSAIPVADLTDLDIDAGLGNARAPEWQDFVSQFAARTRCRLLPPHPPAEGLVDEAQHLVEQGLPILTTMDRAEVDGGGLRPIVDPVPLYPISIVTHRGGDERSKAILRAADLVARERGWLDRTDATWLPEPERSTLGG